MSDTDDNVEVDFEFLPPEPVTFTVTASKWRRVGPAPALVYQWSSVPLPDLSFVAVIE